MFHFAFRFGFGKHFSFNFVFGQPPVTDDEFPKPSRTSCDWPPNISIKKTDPLGKPLDTKVATKHCSLFRLPPEIRTMIYQELLVSESRIRNADRYLVCTQTPILSERKRIHDVDAVFMRTCRSVYDETMPILYGNNVFLFENPDNIRYFRSKGLERPWLLVFNFETAPHGRLTLLRHVIFAFHVQDALDVYQRPSSGRALTQARVSCWREWLLRIFNGDGLLGDEKLEFPSLERLILDFKGWRLTKEDGLLVQPIVDKFGKSEHLKELLLRGVKHGPTRERLKEGLVPGGKMVSVSV